MSKESLTQRNIVCSKCNGKKDYRSKMCNKCRFIYNHPRKGTGVDRYVTKNGYITIMINNKSVYEHRYIMEKSLGRKLTRDDHIHHIDHDRSNNDLSNLELLSCREHHQLHISKYKYEMSRKGHEARWGYKYATDL